MAIIWFFPFIVLGTITKAHGHLVWTEHENECDFKKKSTIEQKSFFSLTFAKLLFTSNNCPYSWGAAYLLHRFISTVCG